MRSLATTMSRSAARLIVAMLLISIAPAMASGRTVQKTEVTIFQPALPSGPRRSGECWTDSIAVARSGVWRCILGNEIDDPCFTSPDLTGAVICGANPASGTPGFVMNLTKPLPKPSSNQTPQPRPWLVKLADGTTCEAATGTMAFVQGIVIPYNCSDSKKCSDSGCPYMTGLAEHFKQGKVWIATKVAFGSSSKGLKLISRKRVTIAAVWK
jgi:hypothetical protein